ncbi:MAG: hypothetical protein K5866_06020 [Treponema sp.]|nr:hypothetical protein [Treponema sp.]
MKKFIFILALLTFTNFIFSQEVEESPESSESPELAESQIQEIEESSEVEIPETVEISDSTELTEEEIPESVEIPEEEESAAAEESSESLEIPAAEENIKVEVTKGLLTPEELEFQALLNQKKEEINSYITENQEDLEDYLDPSELITIIESLKAEIDNHRKDVQGQIDTYFAAKDLERDSQVDQIINAPLTTVETDEFGTQTKSSIERRKIKAQEIIDATEADKKLYLDTMQAQLKNDEKDNLSGLKKIYFVLEKFNYKTTSFVDGLTIKAGPYDGKNGKWTVNIEANLLEVEGLIKETLDLTYSEVTGKKLKDLSKMKEEEVKAYKDTVNLYDSLFREDVPVLYAKLSYKLIHWQQPSEYRFIPLKIEILKIENSRQKVIKKIDLISPKLFTRFPAIEVRDQKTIAKEKEKTINILEKEQKAKERKLGVKLYSDPDVSAKTYGKDPVIQKGRGSLLISVNDFEDFNNPEFGIDHLQADLTLGLGKFGFMGADFGLLFPVSKENMVFNAGLNGGMNVKIGQILRPYILLGADYYTDYRGLAKAGIGCDFILAKVICLNVNYSYNCNMDLIQYLNKEARMEKIASGQDLDIPLSFLHNFSLGIGFAW